MSGNDDKLPAKAKTAEVKDFLDRIARMPTVRPSGGKGRLMFGMDATASREPTWDRACQLQSEMFQETAALGGLEVQLVFYRGFGECRTSPWVDNAADLIRRMTGVKCLGGQTQIEKILSHCLRETEKRRVNALVFVGDCMEEDVDVLCHIAGKLGVLGVPAFMFQEGAEPIATRAFRQIARLTNGAYCSFDGSSARQLRDLLKAVAVYAAGGRRALEDFGKRTGGQVPLLISQVR
ncbi:MAG: VWA domain-containing protein [Alphaproteobacteria bacterium]|nr:VWA domain-containing protein [Alphaproteobacteria bacterium]